MLAAQLKQFLLFRWKTSFCLFQIVSKLHSIGIGFSVKDLFALSQWSLFLASPVGLDQNVPSLLTHQVSEMFIGARRRKPEIVRLAGVKESVMQSFLGTFPVARCLDNSLNGLLVFDQIPAPPPQFFWP